MGLTSQQQQKFIDFINIFKKDRWIYPGAIKRKTSISIEKIYNILNEMQKHGLLQSYFEISCSKCSKSLGDVVESYNDIPNEIYCDHCHETINGHDFAVLIYKVIADV